MTSLLVPASSAPKAPSNASAADASLSPARSHSSRPAHVNRAQKLDQDFIKELGRIYVIFTRLQLISSLPSNRRMKMNSARQEDKDCLSIS